MNDRWDSNPHDRSFSWTFTKQFFARRVAPPLCMPLQYRLNSEEICYAVIFLLRLRLYANLSIRASLQRLTNSATVICLLFYYSGALLPISFILASICTMMLSMVLPGYSSATSFSTAICATSLVYSAIVISIPLLCQTVFHQ